MTTVRLPLFPLNTVLFPGLVLPLNVFEERYRAMMRELLKTPEDEPRQFAVVAIRDGLEVAPSAPGLPDPTAVPERGPAAGFGANGKPDFWIGGEGGLDKPLHVAILARNRAAVDAFYRAAIEAGGQDNGAPGLRPDYHPHYYGAFVIDPEGNNIEAVCHLPE